MIRVLIVDDHEIIRTGLREIFEDYRDIHVAGEAANADTAVCLCRELKPDVVILDFALPGQSGIELTARLHHDQPKSHILVLSDFECSPYPERLMEAGALGYLTKRCSIQELLQAIRAVARGQSHIGSAVAQKLAMGLVQGNSSTPFDSLSAREMEVLLKLTEGQRLSEIAEAMHLSPKTVATYKYRIFDKLETRNDVEVTRLAMRYGIAVPA